MEPIIEEEGGNGLKAGTQSALCKPKVPQSKSRAVRFSSQRTEYSTDGQSQTMYWDPSLSQIDDESALSLSRLRMSTAELRATLERRKTEIKKMIKSLKYAQKVDLCFMVDCTGSMSPWISAVKKGIQELSTRLYATYTDCDLQIAFVRYTDYDQPAGTRTTWIDFTKSTTEFQQFVGRICASGGGDTAEDIMGGLKTALTKLSWRDRGTQVLIHIADAPCHGAYYHGGSVGDDYPNGDPDKITHLDMMEEVVRHEIQYWFGYINKASTDKMIEIFNRALLQQSNYQLSIRQFEAIKPESVTEAVFASVTASVTATARAKASRGTRHKKYSLNTSIPDWSSLESCSATRLQPSTGPVESSADVSCGPASIAIAPQPFAEGGIHLVYHARDRTSGNKHIVLKEPKREGKEYNSVEYFVPLVAAQMEAANYANNFNGDKPMDVPTIAFSSVFVVGLEEPGATGGRKYYLSEGYMEGEYEKYNNNAGSVFKEGNRESDVAQAFSHYTWVKSGKKLVICDIQGVPTRDTGTIYLTDPAIHTLDENGLVKYGSTNLGGPGIQRFFKTHKCNDICKRMALEKYSRPK